MAKMKPLFEYIGEHPQLTQVMELPHQIMLLAFLSLG